MTLNSNRSRRSGTALRRQLGLLVAASAFFMAPATAAENVTLGVVPKPVMDAFIIEQLRCNRDPDTTRVFVALAMRGDIDLHQKDGMDGIACYTLPDGYAVGDLPVDRICGIERETLDWALFPDLYERVPGTFPPEVFEVYSTLPEPALSDWIGTEALNATIENTEYGTALVCGPGQWMGALEESFSD